MVLVLALVTSCPSRSFGDDGGGTITIGNPGSGGAPIVGGDNLAIFKITDIYGNVITQDNGQPFSNPALATATPPDTLGLHNQPGATVTLQLQLDNVSAAHPLNSYSLAFNITDSDAGSGFPAITFTPTLPSGWTSTGSFSASNTSGETLSGNIVLGTLTFQVPTNMTPYATIQLATSMFGSSGSFGLPATVPSSFFDAAGDEISFTSSPITVVATPEPSVDMLLILGLGIVGLTFAHRSSGRRHLHQ